MAVSASATVVLVEGASDKAALETLARRRGRDLSAEGAAVVAMGGATNIGLHLRRLRSGQRVAGLCDAGEESDFRRELELAGYGPVLDRGDLELLGFFVCEEDLEDELIRALGIDAVERVIESQGELASLRRLQRQPAHRGRPAVSHLRRFMGSRSGRKLRYASLLVEALDLDRVPRPLTGVLDFV
jgi:hypothetical protein